LLADAWSTAPTCEVTGDWFAGRRVFNNASAITTATAPMAATTSQRDDNLRGMARTVAEGGAGRRRVSRAVHHRGEPLATRAESFARAASC
jgi:hypothetical protein